MQLRKSIKNRGHFPNDNAAIKLLYLALRNITKDWKMSAREVGYESICDSFRCSVHAAMILTNLLHTQNFRYVPMQSVTVSTN